MTHSFVLAALLAAVTACGTAQSAPPATTSSAAEPEMTTRSGCGVERWAVKTGSDPDISKVDFTPKAATITALTALSVPKTLPPTHRIEPVETTTYTVHATLTEFKLEADSDYHLVIADGGKPLRTMIVELAAPICVTPDPLSTQIAAARKQFDARYHPGLQFQHVSIPVTVTGIGFVDSIHGQAGVAPNGVELHPVMSIVFGK